MSFSAFSAAPRDTLWLIREKHSSVFGKVSEAKYEEEPQITQITGITQVKEQFFGGVLLSLDSLTVNVPLSPRLRRGSVQPRPFS